MFIYVRFCGEYFEARKYPSVKKILLIAINDLKSRHAIPCSVIDEWGDTVYNKKELNKAIEDYCLKNLIDIGTLWES